MYAKTGNLRVLRHDYVINGSVVESANSEAYCSDVVCWAPSNLHLSSFIFIISGSTTLCWPLPSSPVT
jgi:hypothetical protein